MSWQIRNTNDFTLAVESVSVETLLARTVETSRCVGTISMYTTSTVVRLAFIEICTRQRRIDWYKARHFRKCKHKITNNNVETSYFTQLKMRYPMTTLWQRDAGSYQLSHTWDQVISRSRAPSSCKLSKRNLDVRRTSLSIGNYTQLCTVRSFVHRY